MPRHIRSRSRSGVPANWQWREGRPRWIPSPGLRREGWKGHDLRDVQAGWLSRGQSIDRAEAINEAVAGWRRGEPVPAPFLAIAPAGAEAIEATPRGKDPRAIGALLDRYMGVPGTRPGTWKIRPSDQWDELAPKTQQDRRSKLKRFVDVLAGFAVLPPGHPSTWPPETFKRYQAKVALARAHSVYVLQPPAFGEAGEPVLEQVYKKLKAASGHVMAHSTLSQVSAWLTWCRKNARAVPANWAETVARETPRGRLVVWELGQMQRFIARAEAMGLHSLADSMVLGVDLSWSQGDRLALTWDRIGAENRVRSCRRKTGAAMETRLLDTLGGARLDAIRKRQAVLFGPHVKPTHVLVCEDTGAPWKADWYRHRFAEVRDAEGLGDLHDQDLRDTAVTIAYEASLTEPEIASRTGHSLKRIREILDAHYGQISRAVGDNGARKLQRHIRKEGIRL